MMATAQNRPFLGRKSNSKRRRPRLSRLETLEKRQLLADAAGVVTPPVGPDVVAVDITQLPAEITSANPGIISAVADDGIDDAPAIDAAITWLTDQIARPEINTATLYLPPGVFEVAQSIVIDSSVQVLGAGMDLTTLTHTDTLSFSATDVTDIDADVRKVNRSGYLLDFDRAADGSSVQHLTLRGPEMIGGVFAFNVDDFSVNESRFDSFIYSGLRTFNIDGFDVHNNEFIDAGGRKLKANGTLGVTGGGIFSTFTKNAEVSNNRFTRSSDSEVNFFGIKGRKWADSRIHHNTILTNFSIELPFEIDSSVEIDHNHLAGVVSVPKFAGGPELDTGESFHVHHNHFSTSYAIEGARNGLSIDSNVFEFDVRQDNGNLIANFGRTFVPGPLSFTNNLVVNPGRGLFVTQGVHNQVTFANNLIIANQTVSPRSEGLIGLRASDQDGNSTDFNTIHVVDNIIEVNGRSRPLFRNEASFGSIVENNTLQNVSDADQVTNADSGATRGPLTSLQFNVGVDGEKLVDGDAIAAAARGAEQPAAIDTDGDSINDNQDPAPNDASNGLGSLILEKQTTGANFDVPNGTSPLNPATGLTGINTSSEAFETFYAFDSFGPLTTDSATIENGLLRVGTSNGDSFNNRNDSADDYGFMVNPSEIDRFVVSSTVVMPEDGIPQSSGAAIGMQIGTGSQTSYIKFTRTFAGGQNRFEVRWDNQDSVADALPGSSGTRQAILMSDAQEAAAAYLLSLDIDRSNSTAIAVTPFAIALDANGQSIGDTILGTTFTVDGEVADAINGQNGHLPTNAGGSSAGGLFVGAYSTDYSTPFNATPSFQARWASLDVTGIDTTAPTPRLGDLPGGVAVDALDIVFSEPVTGFDLNDLQLSRDGVALSLESASLQTIDSANYQLTGIGDLTDLDGFYDLSFIEGETGIADTAGNDTETLDGSVELIDRVRGFDSSARSHSLITHEDSFLLDSGEIRMNFVAGKTTSGALFSKDHADFGDGGHLTIQLRRGEVQVRLQSDEGSTTIRGGSIESGQPYDLRFAFGEGGMRLFLNDDLVASDDYSGGLGASSGGTGNAEDITLGGSKVRSDAGENNRLINFFTGQISDFEIIDGAGEIVYSEAVTPYDLASSTNRFNGVDQFARLEHADALELETGSVELDFNTVDASLDQTLFSKDNRGFDDGGHLTISIENSQIKVRLQSASRSYVIRSGDINSNTDYSMKLMFGEGGLRLFLDGQLVDSDDYSGGLENNRHSVIIGASQTRANEDADRLEDFFYGTLGNFRLLDASGVEVG